MRVRYKEEMLFPNLGIGETYKFRFFAGLLLIALSVDIYLVSKEIVLLLIFSIFGAFLSLSGLIKELNRFISVKRKVNSFKSTATKTLGRIISTDGGVVSESFSKYPDGDVNSHLYFYSFEFCATVEYENVNGEIVHASVLGLNKSVNKLLRKDVTVYYKDNSVYVEF